MNKWRCTICGYIHEGETPPDVCPLCGAGLEAFEEVTGEQPAASWTGTPVTGQTATAVTGSTATDSYNQDAGTALFKISYGLYIVTSVWGEKLNGQCCNSLFQITSQPLQVAVGINKGNLTHRFILESGVFAATILGQDGHDLVRRFGYRSGRELDKLEGIAYSKGTVTGAPVLEGGIAYLECRVLKEKCVDVGTHTLIVAEVVGGGVKASGEPMTYAYYRQTK